MDKALVDIIFIDKYNLFHEFYKIVANVRLLSTSPDQKKSEPRKGKSVSLDLVILYPTPEIKNPHLNFKLRWCKILPLVPRNYFLLAPTRISLGIENSRRFHLGDYSLLLLAPRN